MLKQLQARKISLNLQAILRKLQPSLRRVGRSWVWGSLLLVGVSAPTLQAQDSMPSISQCKELANGETLEELTAFRKCLKDYERSAKRAREQVLIQRRYDGSVRVIENSSPPPPPPGGSAPAASANPGASATGR